MPRLTPRTITVVAAKGRGLHPTATSPRDTLAHAPGHHSRPSRVPALFRPHCGPRADGWRGGRVVEVTALEMRHTRKGIVGSNPTLSATLYPKTPDRWECEPTVFCAHRRARKGGGSNPTLSATLYPKKPDRWECEPTVFCAHRRARKGGGSNPILSANSQQKF
jgi:hypothetical protein